MTINDLLHDLKSIFAQPNIPISNKNSLLNNLITNDAKQYITSLFSGSKPESALRESFFTQGSILTNFLFKGGTLMPEVSIASGFLDYQFVDQNTNTKIVIELKSLYNKTGKGNNISLAMSTLDWQTHIPQIKKYINSGDFIILTDLKDWYFFSKTTDSNNPKYFAELDLEKFIEEFKVSISLKDYLDRKQKEATKEILDSDFMDSLTSWVNELSKIEFKSSIGNKEKLEKIVGLINKFLFIQTLDDNGIIKYQWIKYYWKDKKELWESKSKKKVIEEFLSLVNEWFYGYYDTDVFKENVLEDIKDDEENLSKFFDKLELILGLGFYGSIGYLGVSQYNFRIINEDVLGKAYETFLAERRKDNGAYYTPDIITEFIAEHTIKAKFDEKLKEIEEAVNNDNFEFLNNLINDFTSMKILDPSCGSGSFLIKAIKILKNEYDKMLEILNCKKDEYVGKESNLTSLEENEKNIEAIEKIKKNIGFDDMKKLDARIVLNHIFGADMDYRAIEVAKLNIWLELIKLNPSEYKYTNIKDITHVLPDLRLNLLTGNSLIGIDKSSSYIKYIKDNFDNNLEDFENQIKYYINNPFDNSPVDTIYQNIMKINKSATDYFYEGLPEKIKEIKNYTIPLNWPLMFWHALLYDDGFDIIIGNPPWGRIKNLIKIEKEKEIYGQYFKNYYKYQKGNFNYYKLFLEKAYTLLKDNGSFGMIFPASFMGEEDSEKLRKLFIENCTVNFILEFPESSDVFSDITQGVIVLIYKKEKKDDYIIKLKTNISREEKNALDKIDYLNLKKSEIVEMTSDKYKIPDFTNPKEEMEILKKLSKIPKFDGLGEVNVGQLDETIDKQNLSDTFTGDMVIKGIHLHQYFVNLDPEGENPRWVKRGDFLNKKPSAVENISKVRIIGRNTENKSTKPRLNFSLLDKEYVITNSIKYIILNDESLNYYIIGLLNSILLNWRFEIFSHQNNIRNYEIKSLPIVRPTEENKDLVDKISTNSKDLIKLEQSKYWWIEEYNNTVKNMIGSSKSLYDILNEDMTKLGRSTPDTRFFEAVSNYKNNFNDKKYKNFYIKKTVNDKYSNLEIFGSNNGYDKLEVFTFNKGELFEFFYTILSLFFNDFNRQNNEKNVKEVFKSIKVPLINGQTYVDSAINLINEVKNNLRKSKGKLNSNYSNLSDLEFQIRDLRCEIESNVFNLYELSNDERKIIMKSYGLPYYVIASILNDCKI